MFSHQSWKISFLYHKSECAHYLFIHIFDKVFRSCVLLSSSIRKKKIHLITIIKLLCVQFLPTTLPADWKDTATTQCLGKEAMSPMNKSASPIFWVLKLNWGENSREWDSKKHDTGAEGLSLIPVMQSPLFHISNAQPVTWFLQQPCESEEAK